MTLCHNQPALTETSSCQFPTNVGRCSKCQSSSVRKDELANQPLPPVAKGFFQIPPLNKTRVTMTKKWALTVPLFRRQRIIPTDLLPHQDSRSNSFASRRMALRNLIGSNILKMFTSNTLSQQKASLRVHMLKSKLHCCWSYWVSIAHGNEMCPF